ncbi:MAG: alpha-glucan family phosphorylase [Gemmatimonadota bacterium]
MTETPHLPPRIAGLDELAQNLWWTWHPAARKLFRHLGDSAWIRSRKNAVEMLRMLDRERLDAMAGNPLFLREYDAVMAEFADVMTERRSWYRDNYGDLASGGIAYFCAEFGVHTSLPIYSGGLGILAGDHFKEGSDLGLPLIGVGLLYQKGYFRQRIGPHGDQLAIDEPFHPETMPIEHHPGPGDEGEHARVRLAGRDVLMNAWKIRVGRATIHLVDTDLESNHPDDRALSHQLYRGDLEMRLRQEIVLGIGGVRVLRGLGFEPAVWHANEGHPAFMALERLREEVEAGASAQEAMRRIARTTVFTTHTPVPAGHDAFPADMIDRYFGEYIVKLGLTRDEFYDLGRHPDDDGRFHMSALALRLADYRNGVSRLHGAVARRMWQGLWTGEEPPSVPETRDGHGGDGNGDGRSARLPDVGIDAPSPTTVPIVHVTNGVHAPSWVSPAFRDLYGRYLGPDWMLEQDDAALWERALDLPDHLVWEAHVACKKRLVDVLRHRARRRWMDEGSEPSQVVAAGTLLDPDVLTLGFARRFATYKRADLVLRDRERLEALLLDRSRPVQLVFAGKAHPADEPGRAILAEVYRHAQDRHLGGRIAFVEDYEINVARDLFSGVDVWLNNPRPPMEASGTSGQKAALNGVPQCSTLDGWWAEGFTRLNGWAINETAGIVLDADGDEAGHDDADRDAATDRDPADRDAADAESLYDTIEREIAPLYYRRDVDGIPRGWVRVMKHAIRTGGANFTARRMLKEYVERFYVPAAKAAVGNGTVSVKAATDG